MLIKNKILTPLFVLIPFLLLLQPSLPTPSFHPTIVAVNIINDPVSYLSERENLKTLLAKYICKTYFHDL